MIVFFLKEYVGGGTLRQTIKRKVRALAEIVNGLTSICTSYFDVVFQDYSFPWLKRVQIARDIASGMVVLLIVECAVISLVLTHACQNVPSIELSS